MVYFFMVKVTLHTTLNAHVICNPGLGKSLMMYHKLVVEVVKGDARSHDSGADGRIKEHRRCRFARL